MTCINASYFKEDNIACCQGSVPSGEDFHSNKKEGEKGDPEGSRAFFGSYGS